MEVPWAYIGMVAANLMLGLAVGEDLLSWVVCYVKFSLLLLVDDPEKLHFHGSGSLSLNGAVGYTYCSGVIAVYWCWRLLVAHL